MTKVTQITSAKPAILFDGSVLADGPMDGIRRYARELLRAMGLLADQYRGSWEIDVCADGHSIWPLRRVVDAMESGKLREFFRCRPSGPATMRSEASRFIARMRRSIAKRIGPQSPRYKALHLPLPNTFYSYQHYRVPLIVTVHDLCHIACPDLQESQNCRTLEEGLAYAYQRNAQFIAVSQSTGNELQRELQVPPEQLHVIPEACNRGHFRPIRNGPATDRLRARYQLPAEPFLFSLCTLEPRKNLSSVLQAFRILQQTESGRNCHLVLAGRAGWGDQERILKAAAGENVHLLGYVPDDDIPALYGMAAAFVCMSYYEGFCLPLLEAMSCGCPVLHSDRSALAEVAGAAGVSATPEDTDEIAAGMRRLVSDAGLRDRCRRLGLARADEFSWDAAARQVLAIYDNAIRCRTTHGHARGRKSAA